MAQRTLLIDKATFPRAKLCGGGVVRQADRYLHTRRPHRRSSVPIRTLRFEFDGGSVVRPHPNAFRVVRRENFDYALLDKVRKRGIIVREGEPVVSLRHVDGAIRVSTTRGVYDAKVLIGADGANRIARRLLGPAGSASASWRSRSSRRASKKRPPTPRPTARSSTPHVAGGLRGYYWDFPSLCDGEPRMNRGIGGSCWPGDVWLRGR